MSFCFIFIVCIFKIKGEAVIAEAPIMAQRLHHANASRRVEQVLSNNDQAAFQLNIAVRRATLCYNSFRICSGDRSRFHSIMRNLQRRLTLASRTGPRIRRLFGGNYKEGRIVVFSGIERASIAIGSSMCSIRRTVGTVLEWYETGIHCWYWSDYILGEVILLCFWFLSPMFTF